MEKLAQLYGSADPALIRLGNGLQNHDNGGMIMRTITCLPALTGQWGNRGGGLIKGNGWCAAIRHGWGGDVLFGQGGGTQERRRDTQTPGKGLVRVLAVSLA